MSNRGHPSAGQDSKVLTSYGKTGTDHNYPDATGAMWTFDYDEAGRTFRESLPEGDEMRHSYAVSAGTATKTRMTDARGNVTAYRFNGERAIVAAASFTELRC